MLTPLHSQEQRQGTPARLEVILHLDDIANCLVTPRDSCGRDKLGKEAWVLRASVGGVRVGYLMVACTATVRFYDSGLSG